MSIFFLMENKEAFACTITKILCCFFPVQFLEKRLDILVEVKSDLSNILSKKMFYIS